MAIPETLIRQIDFSAGQLNEDAARRDDLELQRAGGLVMSDWDLPSSGGLKRRPGTAVRYGASKPHGTVEAVPGVVQDVVFADETIVFYDGASVDQTLTGFPWDDTILDELSWVWVDKFIYVAHQDFVPQVVEYDADAGTWSRRNYDFIEKTGNSVGAPFYRFGLRGVTMTPAALEGSTTIAFSDDVLAAGHVGAHFTYHGYQMQVTAVTDAQNADVDVLDKLPPSQSMVVPSTIDGFRVGDVVEGLTTGARGVIVRVTEGSETLFVVLTDQFQSFTNGEVLVGPTAKKAINSVTNVSPEASEIWEEQFISGPRGWPGAVFYDRNRLGFTNFEQLTTAIIWSAVGEPEDLEIGDDSDDAIFEVVPSQATVLNVTGGPDQFVFTDREVYYIPISADTPLAPGTTEIRLIGAGGCAGIRPVQTNQGIVYANKNLTQIMAVRPTGQTAQPYVLDNISRFHSDLIVSPVAIATTAGDDNAPGGVLYVVNADGTMAVARYDRLNDWVGFVPWTHGGGPVKWVSAGQDTVLIAVEYSLSAGTLNTIEVVSASSYLDGEVTVPEGGLTDTDYADETMHLMRDQEYDGTFTVEGDGDFPVTVGAGEDVRAGWNFEPVFVPFAQNFAGGENFGQRTRRRRVPRTVITVRDTRGGWRCNNKTVASYKAGENEEAAAPLRDETYRFRHLGRSFDPQIEIEQEIPGEITILEVAREMTS